MARKKTEETLTEAENNLPKLSKNNIMKAFPRHRDIFNAILENGKKYDKEEALKLLEGFRNNPL